jgi:hypothetical protein
MYRYSRDFGAEDTCITLGEHEFIRITVVMYICSQTAEDGVDLAHHHLENLA